MEEKLIKPWLESTPYNTKSVIRCKDRYQAFLYMKHGLKPYDVYINGDDMIFIFPKNQMCQELYEKWRKFELK